MSKDKSNNHADFAKAIKPELVRAIVAGLWTTEQVQFALGRVTQPVVFQARKLYGLPFVKLPGNSLQVLFIPDEVQKWAKENNYPFQKVTAAGVAQYRTECRVKQGGRTTFRSIRKSRSEAQKLNAQRRAAVQSACK